MSSSKTSGYQKLPGNDPGQSVLKRKGREVKNGKEIVPGYDNGMWITEGEGKPIFPGYKIVGTVAKIEELRPVIDDETAYKYAMKDEYTHALSNMGDLKNEIDVYDDMWDTPEHTKQLVNQIGDLRKKVKLDLEKVICVGTGNFAVRTLVPVEGRKYRGKVRGKNEVVRVLHDPLHQLLFLLRAVSILDLKLKDVYFQEPNFSELEIKYLEDLFAQYEGLKMLEVNGAPYNNGPPDKEKGRSGAAMEMTNKTFLFAPGLPFKSAGECVAIRFPGLYMGVSIIELHPDEKVHDAVMGTWKEQSTEIKLPAFNNTMWMRNYGPKEIRPLMTRYLKPDKGQKK